MKLKINKKILIVSLISVLIAVSALLFLNTNRQSQTNDDQVSDNRSTVEIFNDGDFETVKNQADESLENQSLSSKERGEAFYAGLVSRVGEESPETAYTYLVENRSYINELELPFDFYVNAIALTEEYGEEDFLKELYKKALSIEFEEGQSEELLIQSQIEEKLNEIE